MTAVILDKNVSGTSSDKNNLSLDKNALIQTACENKDVETLVRLASSEGGLVTDHLRATAWPVLLGCNHEGVESNSSNNNQVWKELPPHRDEEQVEKDVDRAFVYYPEGETQLALRSKKMELSHLILRVLRTNQMLHYFQGYHDIAQVFLLVLGEDAAGPALERVSLLRIRDYMLASLEPATKHLDLIPAILRAVDVTLAQHLAGTRPYFALSAVLTLYAHDMTDYGEIARLFDFILAHEPIMSVYLFVATVLSRRSELLDIPADEPDMLLFTLTKLPQPLNLQGMIDRCLQIFRAYPPEELPGRAWSNISGYSVLKTSRDIARPQSLEHARAMFVQQSRQLSREEFKKKTIKQLSKNRRPIILGATVVVGILSYYLRKSGSDKVLWSTLWRVADALRK